MLKIKDESLLQYAKYIKTNIDINDIKILEYITDYDILIIFNNDKKYIYDTFLNSYRYLKYNKKDLTEEEWLYEYGDRLKQIMKRKNISQNQLASYINIDQSLISRYISGQCIPSSFIFYKIMDALNCTTKDILFVPYILKNIYINN